MAHDIGSANTVTTATSPPSLKRPKKMEEEDRSREIGAGGGASGTVAGGYTKNEKKKKTKRFELVSYKDLPEYMKDNEFILSHYRVNWPLDRALLSVFLCHNETLNVWTHLLGFILFLGLTLANSLHLPLLRSFGFTSAFPANAAAHVLHNSNNFINMGSKSSPDMSSISQWPIFVFLAGSMFCLLSSSSCHLFCCHSQPLNTFLTRLDYIGITVMIITSFFPPIYYIFQCNPVWQITYLSIITAIGIFTITTILLSSAKFRTFRALLFVAMGLFGVVPAVHGSVVNWDNPRRFVTMGYEAVMALCYLTGTVFYVSRVPERWRPGWFDLVGHSHQIFHVFVVLGALAHYGASLVFLEYRGAAGCPVT